MKSNLQRRENRQFGRRWSHIHGWIAVKGRPRTPCVVSNVSEGGAYLEVAFPAALPYTIRLVIDALGFEIDCDIVHVRKSGVGVSFVDEAVVQISAKPLTRAELLEGVSHWHEGKS